MNRPYLNHSSQAIIDLCKRSIHQKDTLLALREEISFRRERFTKGPKEVIDFAISLHDHLVSESEIQEHHHLKELTVRDAYVILGVQPGWSLEVISNARRRLVQQYHPDKVASLGKKLQLVAESETKLIDMAFDLILKDRQAH